MSSPNQEPLDPAAGSASARLGFRDLMKVSRAGLMASHLWLFLLPVALSGSAPGAEFWIGALYVTVPLGMLIYGWNDFFDADVDALSRRKKGTLATAFFGCRLPRRKRRWLPAWIVALHLPFLLLALLFGQWWALAWLPVMVIANGLYNGPGVRLSRIPVVAESTALWIYLNILWLSILMSGLDQPWAVWALAAAAVLFFQISGAIVDIGPDRRVGKITFAAMVGESWAARALAGVVAFKGILLLVSFQAPLAAALNLAAVPFCLAPPALANSHWSGLAYVYFVIIDWACLLLLAT